MKLCFLSLIVFLILVNSGLCYQDGNEVTWEDEIVNVRSQITSLQEAVEGKFKKLRNLDENLIKTNLKLENLTEMIANLTTKVDEIDSFVEQIGRNKNGTHPTTLELLQEQINVLIQENSRQNAQITDLIMKLGKLEQVEKIAPVENSTIYFDEQFLTSPIRSRWIISRTTHIHDKTSTLRRGVFILSPGSYYVDPVFERGLLTLGENSFYGISTKSFRPFSTQNYPFILQYSAKFEQKEIGCTGGYIKLFGCSLDPPTRKGGTKHLMSFGPSQCSDPSLKLNVFQGSNDYSLYNGPLIALNNNVTHVYTLVIFPNERRSFEILIDGGVVKVGNYKDVVSDFNGFDSVCGIGFEMYQQHSGTVYDNILMTSNKTLALERVTEILRITKASSE